MAKIQVLLSLFVFAAGSAGIAAEPVWPPPPDAARVEYAGQIRCADLKRERSLAGSIARLVSGGSKEDGLLFPFDVEVAGEKMFLTCQELPALVEVDRTSNRYRLHESNDLVLRHPVAVCNGGGKIYVTDSENAAVYVFDGASLEPLITEGLVRPTGIAYLEDPPRLYVIDTGAHSVEEFDLDGGLTGGFGDRGAADAGLNYPTFASSSDGILLVNDTLNYKIKLFAAGELLNAIGLEGDGPGAFARPKGIAVDAAGNIYVVDGLFDNIQIFDRSGRIALVVGSAGRGDGQFWSPAGIDIAGDLVYVADTFNHRIQILRILEG